MTEEFIRENRKFWSTVKVKPGGKKLLIEEFNHPSVAHVNAFYALVLNQARGYVPVWLDKEESRYNLEFVGSYCSEASMITTKIRPWYKKILVLLLAAAKFLQICFKDDVLSFHYDGVKYGDILYDVYLTLYGGRATIKFMDPRLIRTIGSIIFRHREIRDILQSGNYAGVMACHQVGIDGGVMFRAALRYGYAAFLVSPDLQPECLGSPDELYNFQGQPYPKDIDQIIQKLGDGTSEAFAKTLQEQVQAFAGRGGNDPYSKSHRFYTDRAKFNADFGLDPDKKNIFVMLHSFNDHPRSHFRWMLFQDYFVWFYQTLQFAKKHPKVNWIFKQHPMVKYYPMKHVKIGPLFKNLPGNIIFIDGDRQIDTRSLVVCADLVITCLGSAGFELPAMGGIPSLTAGDNFYTGLGFAREPKTQAEYFEILSRADKIEKLSAEQQRRAQAAYLYIYKFSRPNLAVIPELSVKEDRDIENINSWYWGRVLEVYKSKRDAIISEFQDLAMLMQNPNFKRLNRLDNYQRQASSK